MDSQPVKLAVDDLGRTALLPFGVRDDVRRRQARKAVTAQIAHRGVRAGRFVQFGRCRSGTPRASCGDTISGKGPRMANLIAIAYPDQDGRVKLHQSAKPEPGSGV
jgi:hypothetical protein